MAKSENNSLEHVARCLESIKSKIKSIKLNHIAISISIFAVLVSLFGPIIVNDYLAKPNFIVSSYISDGNLFISIFNKGLGIGSIQSVGYCYYNESIGGCESGTLMNFQNFKTIKSKEGESIQMGVNHLSQILASKNKSVDWSVILCGLDNECYAYVFDDFPRCQVERSFIDKGTILNRMEYQQKRVKLSFEDAGAEMIDPDFDC